MMTIKEIADHLVSGKYAYWHGRRLKFYTRFYEELEQASPAPMAGHKIDWQAKYLDFIKEAQIPARLEDSRGGYYSVNKYSEPGMKAFRKAVEGGIDYHLLVRSTNLYYRSGVKLKVAIGRYMMEGLWRTDYDALTQSLEDSKQHEYEQQTLSNGTHTSWTVG